MAEWLDGFLEGLGDASTSWVTLLTGLLAAGASVISLWSARRSAQPRKPPSIADDIETLQENLTRSARLMKKVQSEVDLQVAALAKVKAEAEENQRLAELNKEQAEAVRRVIASTNEAAAKPNRRQQWLFFLAGLFSSVPLGVAGNFVYDLITK
ncbi:hypothetical protein ABTX61_21450 [Amycolatopsis japonica]|uniref:hypothetical protein n=1 Tax=Amycolatopsis japonica TaxID=208439 RepID=UPI0033243A2E